MKGKESSRNYEQEKTKIRSGPQGENAEKGNKMGMHALRPRRRWNWVHELA